MVYQAVNVHNMREANNSALLALLLRIHVNLKLMVKCRLTGLKLLLGSDQIECDL